MKNIRRPKGRFGILIGLSLLFASCQEKNMMEYFEEPSWLRGSIYEELQSSGNYTLFLKGVDKAGISSIRVNDQYRIEFTVKQISSEAVVTICNILELSNHYK